MSCEVACFGGQVVILACLGLGLLLVLGIQKRTDGKNSLSVAGKVSISCSCMHSQMCLSASAPKLGKYPSTQ